MDQQSAHHERPGRELSEVYVVHKHLSDMRKVSIRRQDGQTILQLAQSRGRWGDAEYADVSRRIRTIFRYPDQSSVVSPVPRRTPRRYLQTMKQRGRQDRDATRLASSCPGAGVLRASR